MYTLYKMRKFMLVIIIATSFFIEVTRAGSSPNSWEDGAESESSASAESHASSEGSSSSSSSESSSESSSNSSCKKPPPLPCGPNEIERCVKNCPPQKTCRNRGIIYDCARDPRPCNKKCVCAQGYYRNAIGECITGKQCDQCPNPNEFWSCNSACDNKCINIDTQNRTNCPIVNIKCNEMCYCDDGYARDNKGNCIPVSECKKCPPNEVYADCPSAICGPLTCAEAGFPKKNCKRSDSCPSGPGCICKGGYLRNKKGVCIPQNECPSCGGDKNAILGCSNYCGRTCADIGQPPRICPPGCILNGCNCRENYYYDTNIKKCVKPKDCTPTCKANEEFSDCANAICRPQQCKDKGVKFLCKLTNKSACIPGCICKNKYLRKNGVCVPEDQCDNTKC